MTTNSPPNFVRVAAPPTPMHPAVEGSIPFKATFRCASSEPSLAQFAALVPAPRESTYFPRLREEASVENLAVVLGRQQSVIQSQQELVKACGFATRTLIDGLAPTEYAEVVKDIVVTYLACARHYEMYGLDNEAVQFRRLAIHAGARMLDLSDQLQDLINNQEGAQRDTNKGQGGILPTRPSVWRWMHQCYQSVSKKLQSWLATTKVGKEAQLDTQSMPEASSMQELTTGEQAYRLISRYSARLNYLGDEHLSAEYEKWALKILKDGDLLDGPVQDAPASSQQGQDLEAGETPTAPEHDGTKYPSGYLYLDSVAAAVEAIVWSGPNVNVIKAVSSLSPELSREARFSAAGKLRAIMTPQWQEAFSRQRIADQVSFLGIYNGMFMVLGHQGPFTDPTTGATCSGYAMTLLNQMGVILVDVQADDVGAIVDHEASHLLLRHVEWRGMQPHIEQKLIDELCARLLEPDRHLSCDTMKKFVQDTVAIIEREYLPRFLWEDLRDVAHVNPSVGRLEHSPSKGGITSPGASSHSGVQSPKQRLQSVVNELSWSDRAPVWPALREACAVLQEFIQRLGPESHLFARRILINERSLRAFMKTARNIMSQHERMHGDGVL